MNVRATDSNSNTTSSGYASDTFTIDVTAPTSIDLDSPGDNSYTNSERPTYKWKATTDATAGLSKYVLEIDNPSLGSGQPAGDFTIDDIPTSRTTDYEKNKYLIHYENFSDSDSTNNYISVYTKSHSDWGSSENDGKLREGRVSWNVKAVDNVSNETSSSRTLFVDRTSPTVAFTKINSMPYTTNNFSTTDKTPTLFGKITDPLAGGDSSQSQTESGPKVASGPKQVDIKVEKKDRTGYKLLILYIINMDKLYYACDDKEISDNSKQKCDKYLPFEYTPKENLELGTYKIILTGKDKADNNSSETSFMLNITTLAQIITPEEKKIVEEEIKPLKPEEKEKIKEELEITKPTEPVKPTALEKTVDTLIAFRDNFFNSTINLAKSISSGISKGVTIAFSGIGQGVKFIPNTTGQILAFVGKTASSNIATLYNSTQSIVAFVGHETQLAFNFAGQGLAFTKNKTGEAIAYLGQGMSNTGKAIGNGYSQLANNTPGIAKIILTGTGDRVTTTASTIANTTKSIANTSATIAKNTVSTIASVTNSVMTTTTIVAQNTGNKITKEIKNLTIVTSTIARNTSRIVGNVTNTAAKTTGDIAQKTGLAIASATQKTFNNAKMGISNVTLKVGEKTEDVSSTVGYAIVQFGYLFVNEPTKISDVKVIVLSPTSAKVSWVTNHPANSKVSYGLDETHPLDIQTDKRTTYHEFTLSNLTPNTEYHFEVMSQNKNYVYDANRKFKTPAK